MAKTKCQVAAFMRVYIDVDRAMWGNVSGLIKRITTSVRRWKVAGQQQIVENPVGKMTNLNIQSIDINTRYIFTGDAPSAFYRCLLWHLSVISLSRGKPSAIRLISGDARAVTYR